jgi:diacylglycerol kinase family enzyme
MERPASTPKEFAVILNENARRVTRRVIRTAREIAPRIALYSSRTQEEAYQILKELMDRGVRRIISGGGDGTFFHLVSQAKKLLEEQNQRIQKMGRYARGEISRISLPEFGILKLGTGNSFAPLLGIQKGLAPVRMLAGGEDFATRRIHLLESEGQCFTFCGLGWDARILNDYMWLKRHARSRISSRFAQSLFGYLAAMTLRTIPSVLLSRRQPRVTVRNLGPRVFRILPGNRLFPLKCPEGAIVYQGPCNVIGMATTPYYGYGLKAFPHAMKEPGTMHLRILTAGVSELILHAWPIWQGTYQSPHFLEFLAEKVHLGFSEPMPLQRGGDAEGTRLEVSVQVSDLTVDLLDFHLPLVHHESGSSARAAGGS